MANSTSSSPKQVSDAIARRFEPARATLRPRECDRGVACWVHDGAAAYAGHASYAGGCIGCKGAILIAGNETKHYAVLMRCVADSL